MHRSIVSSLAFTVVVVLVVSQFPGPGGGCAHAEPAAEDGQTFWLSYHQNRGAESMLRYLRGQSVPVVSDQPEGVDPPEGLGDHQQFGRWKTPLDAAGFRHVAMARSGEDGLCDQLVIDTDGDGKLDDESVVEAFFTEPHGRGRGRVHFGPIELRLDSDDGPTLYHLTFNVYCRGDDWRPQATAAGWYEGVVEIGGKATLCQLIDYNANGSFGDVCDEGDGETAADRVRFSTRAMVEPAFAGRYVRHEGALYEFTAAPDGACVTIRAADDVATGSLTPPDGFTAVQVYGPRGLFTVGPGDEGVVPVGRYHLRSWQREVTADDGREWRFSGSRFPGDATVVATADTRTVLELGGPWVAKLEHHERRGTHSIGQKLYGRFGEQVDARYANGARVPAPRLQVASEDGGYERTFKFEYG